MRSIFHGRRAALLSILLALLAGAQGVLAQDTADLLPVTEAYQLSSDTATPGVLKLHWTIAPDYYLYRGRMKFKAGDGVTLGDVQLPDGEKHVDPYLGPVETYHHGVDATVPYTASPGTARLKLSVFGGKMKRCAAKWAWTKNLQAIPRPSTMSVPRSSASPPLEAAS